MTLVTRVELFKKGKWYIARSVELDFVTQGTTSEEAKNNLIELISIQFQEMKEMGTFRDYLDECGYTIENDTISPTGEIIGFENISLQVA